MKTVLFTILSAFVLVSCLKSDNRDLGADYSGEGNLKYDLNAYPFEITGGVKSIGSRGIGVYAKKQLKSATVPATRYVIMGQIGVGKQINVTIVTDSLKPGNYTSALLANGVTFAKFDSVQYSNNRAADVLTVTVSGYSGGVIEGTFAGKLSMAKTSNGATTYTDALIENGSFKNIVVQFP